MKRPRPPLLEISDPKVQFPRGLLVIFRTTDRESNLHREPFPLAREVIQDREDFIMILDGAGNVLAQIVISAITMFIPLPDEAPANANH